MHRGPHRLVISTLFVALAFTACRSYPGRDRLMQTPSFQALPPEYQAAIRSGDLCVGMDTNAVLVGWGQPGEIVRAESEAGREMRWLYYGSWTRQTPYWTYTPNPVGAWTLDARVHHQSERYLKAVAVFQQDRLIRWQKLPRPSPP